MDFVRVDPDDGSILLVKVDDLEGILASKNNVVVKLVGPGHSRKPWPRDMGYGTEVQPP